MTATIHTLHPVEPFCAHCGNEVAKEWDAYAAERGETMDLIKTIVTANDNHPQLVQWEGSAINVEDLWKSASTPNKTKLLSTTPASQTRIPLLS